MNNTLSVYSFWMRWVEGWDKVVQMISRKKKQTHSLGNTCVQTIQHAQHTALPFSWVNLSNLKMAEEQKQHINPPWGSTWGPNAALLQRGSSANYWATVPSHNYTLFHLISFHFKFLFYSYLIFHTLFFLSSILLDPAALPFFHS